MVEGILMVLGGMLFGSQRTSPSLDASAVDEAWQRFWTLFEHRRDQLSLDELVHLDKLQEIGGFPPGWRMGRTVVLGPGQIESDTVDGAIYQVWDPNIIWLEPEDIERALLVLHESPGLFARQALREFGYPLSTYKILACTHPDKAHTLDYRLRSRGRARGVSGPLGDVDEDHRQLLDSGFPFLNESVIVVEEGHRWDRGNHLLRSEAALRDGWLLGFSQSDPNNVLVLDPPPSFSIFSQHKKNPDWERLHEARIAQERMRMGQPR